jgi:hypothetical protein
LFGLFVGVLVDRRSRFAILMAADLLRAVIILAAAMAAGCGQLSIWLAMYRGIPHIGSQSNLRCGT